MRIFKATAPASVASPRFRRFFERDEKVTEAELEMVVDHFRKCFEPEPEPSAPKAPEPAE